MYKNVKINVVLIMKIKAEYIIYVLIALIILNIGYYIFKQCTKAEGLRSESLDFVQTIFENKVPELKDPKCVCAFDIDHTISCGNPKPYVDACVRNGCKIALNTARPIKYVKDVDIVGMGMVDPLS